MRTSGRNGVMPTILRTAGGCLLACCFLGGVAGQPMELGAAEDAANSTAVELRLTNYNIRHGRGMDQVVDLERIARVLRDTRPDLIALQEVDVGTQRTGGVDQAARLAELTDQQSLFGEAIAFQGGEYGNAVLSRFPIVEGENLPLPGSPGQEARAAVFATVRVPGWDEPLAFASFHLDHRSRADRLAQIQALIDYVRDLGHPAILAGDLNAEPDSEEYQLATSFFTDLVPDNREGTFSSTDPRRRIDYFLFHPGADFECVDYQVIPEEVASDHRPLRMTVRRVAR